MIDRDGFDLGNGHMFTWMLARAGRYDVPEAFRNWEAHLNPDEDRHDLIGIIDWHPKQNPANEEDTTCGGGVYFVAGINNYHGKSNPVWTVESLNPLTISPSILCGCGEHGFIRDGKWISA